MTVATGYSNNDITTENDTEPNTEKTETKGVSFIAGNGRTRTSLNYDTSNFYWENGDKIYVKDEDNVSNTAVILYRVIWCRHSSL